MDLRANLDPSAVLLVEDRRLLVHQVTTTPVLTAPVVPLVIMALAITALVLDSIVLVAPLAAAATAAAATTIRPPQERSLDSCKAIFNVSFGLDADTVQGQAQSVCRRSGEPFLRQKVEIADFLFSNCRMKDTDGDGKRGIGE